MRNPRNTLTTSVDDPFLWGCLPWKFFYNVDDIRWGLGAANVCFKNSFFSYFFSLGKVLATERFGRGPFQGSVDASVRLLCPDNTLSMVFHPSEQKRLMGRASWFRKASEPIAVTRSFEKIPQEYHPPLQRKKTSWLHIFPEGYVCQMQPPHSNSMRYFRWGTSRLLLEPTVAPVVVPIFGSGFEKIAPESTADDIIERYTPHNRGAEINVVIGDPIEDEIIERFREKWRNLCSEQYDDQKSPNDLSFSLKFGKQAQKLRSEVAAMMREKVVFLRDNVCKFPKEDSRLKDPAFWKRYTASEGLSDPDIKFIGKNWAIKRLQTRIKNFDEYGNELPSLEEVSKR